MSGKALILVVEDEPIVALDLQHTLRRFGYDVPVTLSSGEEALAHAPELKPDLALMDINLAGDMDGIETARRLWTQWRIPVVYLTAYSTQEVVQRATAAEPFGYLTKPFSPGALGSTIEVALYKHRMAEELRQAHEQLENRVAERTQELSATNLSLQREILRRERVEAELRQAKEAAENANRVKTEFLANMSHELRTPLNAIIGYGEILLEEAEEAGGQPAIEPLEQIQRAARQLLALVNNIMDLTRIEAGRMEVTPESVPLAEFLRSIHQAAQPLAEVNQNQLSVTQIDPIGVITADPARLRQCLMNLLSNAAKFTREGRIDVLVSMVGDGPVRWLEVRVRDTGIGIDKADAAGLFDAFTQVDGSSTRRYGGTGLGLAITSRLCELMGGELTVESLLGHGSTFTIRIPQPTS